MHAYCWRLGLEVWIVQARQRLTIAPELVAAIRYEIWQSEHKHYEDKHQGQRDQRMARS